MGISNRIIGRVDLHDGEPVKGRQLEGLQRIHNPIPSYANNFDEIWIDDVSASLYRREPNFQRLSELTSNVFIPLIYSGGVKTLAHIQECLRNGADRVGICSQAILNPEFLHEAKQAFGQSTLVLTIQMRKSSSCWYFGGREKSSKSIQELIDLGSETCGEIILHSVDRDGMLMAFAPLMITAPIHISVAGGGRSLKDCFVAHQEGASGACLASAALRAPFQSPRVMKMLGHLRAPTRSRMEAVHAISI